MRSTTVGVSDSTAEAPFRVDTGDRQDLDKPLKQSTANCLRGGKDGTLVVCISL